MNIKIFVLIFGLIFILGCEDQRKVKVFEPYEFEYYTDKEVDVSAKFTNSNWKTENSELQQLANNVIKDSPEFQDKIEFHFRVFIDSDGNIKALKKIKRTGLKTGKIEDEFLMKIGELWNGKKITPANIDGINVNSKKDFKIGFEIHSDTLRLFLPDFLNNGMPIFGSNDGDINEYVIFADEMPEPIGGIKSIQSKIKYPQIARLAGIEGRVLVKAFINEEGEVIKTAIIKGIGAGCDEAALNAVRETKFTSASLKGKTVCAQVAIPIMFRLDSKSEK